MTNSRDYQELTNRISLYIDDELSSKEARQFLQEIRMQPESIARLKQEQSFKTLLQRSLPRRKVSPAFAESIKNSIQITV